MVLFDLLPCPPLHPLDILPGFAFFFSFLVVYSPLPSSWSTSHKLLLLLLLSLLFSFIYIYIYFFLLGGSFWEQYWFRYNSKTRRFQNFFKRFVKVIERRIIHVKFTKQINNAFVNETEEKTLKLSVLLINSLIISGYLKTLWWLTATWMWLVDFDPLALWLAGGWKLKGIPNMLSFRVRLFSCTAKTVISSGNVPFYNYSRSPVYGHPLDMDTSLIRTVFMLPRVEALTFSLNSICF